MASNCTPVPATYRFLYKPVDNCESDGCHLDVMLPEDKAADDVLPVAFMIHGGAWSVGSSTDLAHNAVHYYLEHGYAVCSPEYRLCPHVKQLDCRHDILEAYTFVQRQLNDKLAQASNGRAPKLATERIFATGGSAGGTASVTLALDIHEYNSKASDKLPELKAIVPAYPAVHQSGTGFQEKPTSVMEDDLPKTDPEMWKQIEQFLKGKVVTDFKTNSLPLDMNHPRNMWCNKAIEYNCLNSYLLGNPPYPERAHILPFIGSWFPPTYVVAAVKDTLIPVQHSYDLYDRVKSQGVEAHIGKAEDAEHGFTEWPHAMWPEGNDWWNIIQKSLDWAIGKTSA